MQGASSYFNIKDCFWILLVGGKYLFINYKNGKTALPQIMLPVNV